MKIIKSERTLAKKCANLLLEHGTSYVKEVDEFNFNFIEFNYKINRKITPQGAAGLSLQKHNKGSKTHKTLSLELCHNPSKNEIKNLFCIAHEFGHVKYRLSKKFRREDARLYNSFLSSGVYFSKKQRNRIIKEEVAAWDYSLDFIYFIVKFLNYKEITQLTSILNKYYSEIRNWHVDRWNKVTNTYEK